MLSKLVNQSPLYDIVKRINELVDEMNTNKTIYENFKPVSKEKTKTLSQTDLPIRYPIDVIGIYSIGLETESGGVTIDVYKGEILKRTLVLNGQIKTITGLFFDKDEVLVIKGEGLSKADKLSISLEKNILNAFIDQYEANLKSISENKKIAEESKKQFQEIKTTIDNFYNILDYEFASQQDLKELLSMLD